VNLESTSLRNSFIKDGLNFWPAVRIRLAFGLIERRYKSNTPKPILREILGNLLKNAFSLRKNFQKSDVLFVTHPNYQCVVGGQTYDRVLEGYKLECREKGETYSELNLATGVITFQDDEKSAKHLWFRLFLIKAYVYTYSRLFNKGIVGVEGLVAIINREVEKKFPNHHITALQISQYVNYISCLTYFYGSVLGKLGVSRVCQATYYDPVGLSINAAASQLGVKTFCAQHGGQSKNNPAFGQWTNIPANGYAMLPDVFLCWDEESSNTILNWSLNNTNHTAQITGYHWPNLWRSGKIAHERVNVTDGAFGPKLNILYSMQPSIGLPPGVIQQVLEHFPSSVNWWLRLHPRQLGTRVETDLRTLYADNSNILISEATERPLPVLMSFMDLHITCFSSCVYEAIAFDVPTLFIHKAGQEYFNGHIQSGKAKTCFTTNQLMQEIEERIKIIKRPRRYA
jgi:hypothetical protein